MRIRRGVVVTPTGIDCVVGIDFSEGNEFDRTVCDDQMSGDPIMVKKQGSGTINIKKGTLPRLYDQTLVVQTESVSVVAGVETVTQDTHTFTKVTTNRSFSIDNDSPSSSQGSLAIEFGEYYGPDETPPA